MWRPLPPALVPATETGGRIRGMRIAGGAMILGAIVALGTPLPTAATASPAVYRIGAALPILLGIGLVLGNEIVRRIAIAFLALGLLGAVAIGVATHLWVITLIAGVFVGAYLLLLVGEPGGGRLVLGCIILGSGLAAGFLVRGGPGPLATKALQLGDQIEGEPVERVAGSVWSFQTPPQRWYVSKKRFPDFEGGVGLERAVVRPEGAAVALLFSTRTPANRGFDLDEMTNEVSKAWEKSLPAYKLHGVAPLPGRGGTRVLHMSSKVDGADFEALCGLFPNAPMFYVLVAGASPREFPALREELEGILASFRSETLPPEPTPTPTDLERAVSAPRLPQPAPDAR